MVWLEIDASKDGVFCGDLAAIQFPVQKWQTDFPCIPPRRGFTSTYNVQMYKYDHETGKALKGARFGFFERFDDKTG